MRSLSHIPVGLLLLALVSASFTGCETMTSSTNPLNFVPVDDLGDAAYYEAPVPLASATPAPRRAAPEPARRIESAPRRESPQVTVGRMTSLSTGREMQRPSFAGLAASAPVTAFEEPSKRFVKDDQSGTVQPLDSSSGPVLESRIIPAARVVHANAGDKYVILLCEKMPKPGEDAQIFREGKQVGEVRFVSNRKGRYIVADIVSGEPRRGDLARFACLFPQKEAVIKEKPKKAENAEPEKKRNRGLPLFF
ncbi:MAG: hypothetical protein PHG65_01050 [Kiritimatiellae bacterium]|nr:hypothetical protein [Kiritimatiellia bacterium]